MAALRIGLTFFRIGALAFGGLGATLALIEREIVERRALLSRNDVAEALTYTKLLPGSTVVQVVAYLGWRIGGCSVSALATVAFVLPSAALMVLLAAGDAQLAGLPDVLAIRRGVLTAVIALLAVTMERLARPCVTSVLPAVLGLAAFGAAHILGVSAVWIVAAAGLVGVLADRRRS